MDLHKAPAQLDQRNAAARQLEIPEQVCAINELTEMLSNRISMLEERLMSVSRPPEPQPERPAKEARGIDREVARPVSTSLGEALYNQAARLHVPIERIDLLTARLEV